MFLKFFILCVSILFIIFQLHDTYAKPTDASISSLSFNQSIVNETKIDSNSTDKVLPNVDLNENVNKISDFDEDEVSRELYARKMITYMNQSVDPCEDFYEYACGNWKNTLIDRQSPHKRNNLLDISYELADMIEDLLQHPDESLKNKYSKELELAQVFYTSCLNANLDPLPKSQIYLDVIKSVGGFPAVDASWRAENFSWFNASAKLSNYGVSGFTYEEIIPQFPFPPYFKMPELGFDLIVHSDNFASNDSRGYQLNEQRMRQYLTTYGVESEDKVNEVIHSIFGLWRAILKVADEFDEDKDECRRLSLIKNITDWKQWDNYYKFTWKSPMFVEHIPEHPCDYFYTKLDEICNEHKEAAANYLAMKFLHRMDARLEDKKFQREYCNLKVKSHLPYLIDKLYVAKHFNPEIRTEVTTIIKEVRKSLRETLEEVDWLDEETRKEALLKESTIEPRIGSFENDEMMDRLIKEMNRLSFEEANFEDNNVQIAKFKQYMKRYNGLHHNELSNDTKPLELMIGMQVNAFYYNIDNSINVMAGILHPPAYHKSWPYSLKFGTLGYLVGHEFTHGFDTVGAFYDSNGEERYWWSDKSGKVFEERANCYAEKFNGYFVPEIKRNINGNQTKDENIADNGGLRDAYSSYLHFVKKLDAELNENSSFSLRKKEESMPGLDLTPEQIFFLGFAQLWCSDYQEEHYWEELNNDHTMDKFRVLGSVSNVEDFAKAYACPIGSKMNPKPERCELW